MTQTYSQIQKQIEALQRKAEQLKTSEILGVVDRIKVAIAHYGLTAEQLGFGTRPVAGVSKPGKPAPVRQSAKYGDGQGQVWSGRGPRPKWLRDALAAGRKLEEFAVATAPAETNGKQGKAAAERASVVRFRDEAGHTWSGRGPRPGWLKDALASGKTLEDLSV